MLDDQRPGTVHWIDHYAVGTNDLERWVEFHERVLGARTIRPNRPNPINIFQEFTGGRHGGFVQQATLPPSAGPGKGLPRYGFFVRQADIDEHLRRLDDCRAAHTGAIRTSSDGEEGIAVYWEDPDGNQFEFWAPNTLPEGAMDGCGPLKIGRISHGVFESRDLQRTAAFFDKYCALEPMSSADLAPDTLVLPLAAGGRLVFKKTDMPGERTTGRGILRDVHTALVLRPEDFWPAYERMWADLPEWDFDAERDGVFAGDWQSLPARTAVHPSPAGRAWHAAYGRGDDWYDPDTNLFHFFGGTPIDGSMARYEPHSIEDYAQEYLEAHGLRYDKPKY
ncbi:MAG TPA: VOC family protein [Chloroflexota bacterium]|nr:VOC family protein [Chloroflexota bacterium]